MLLGTESSIVQSLSVVLVICRYSILFPGRYQERCSLLDFAMLCEIAAASETNVCAMDVRPEVCRKMSTAS